MKKWLFIVVLFSNSLLAQNKIKSFFSFPDTINHTRLKTVVIGQGTIWLSSMYGLNKAWYANYPRSRFQFYNDIKEWQQVDKVGHAWSAYWGAQLSSSLFRWSGVSQKKSALYGAGMGIAYVSVIEVLDGFSKEWGFSVGDIAANTSGALLFASQEYAWQEQRIQFKFSSSFWKKYATAEEQQRAHNLYGNSPFEKILKDYNHQTYWLSLNPWSFNKESHFPKWLNIAVGYGADGMLGGYENYGTDKITNRPYNFSELKRVRQFYISPDIDLSKIEFRGHKFKLLKALNVLKIKFPMPALEYNNEGKLIFHPLFF